jgi:prolyl oligopeptidase
MMRSLLVHATLATLVATAALAQSPRLQYPVTAAGPVVDTLHHQLVPDPYRWLEDLNSPQTGAWVRAENAVTMSYLATLPNRDAIRKRITDLWNYPKVSIPYFEGGRWYLSRNTGLQRQSVIYTRQTLLGRDHVALDPNTLSPDGSIALSGFSPSPDGRYVAFAQSEGGADWATYRVREIATGRELGDTIRWIKFSGVSWTHDGRGFFYARYPEPGAATALSTALTDRQLFYHVLGTPQSQDVLIYERKDDPALFFGGSLDETGRYLFITTNHGTSTKNELYVADLGDHNHPVITATIRPLYTGHDAEYNPMGVVNGEVYLLTDRDAPRRRVVAAPLDTSDPARWRVVVPQGAGVISDAALVAGRVAVSSLEDVASVIRLYKLSGALERTVALPGLGTASTVAGRYDRPEIFYSFSSPLYPATVFRYDPVTNTSAPFEAPKLTFDPSRYETQRVFYTSKDGTRIPMFLTYRKGLVRDGTNPTMVYAYGGFDISTMPSFRPDVPMWLEMGGIWATASLRGGGEYGDEWHKAGMFEKKQNVFDDFIAAGEYLVKEKYTSSARMAMMGASNGGLLIGAVMTQRPDLFGVALPAVGVMDMLRYHKFTGGALWSAEYGSADDSVAFNYIRAYSPLQNIKPGTCYPATLVTTADHDDRVVPSHSFKFTSALQKAQSCDHPVLIRIETQGSHGYRPTDKRIAELADEWAFTAANMGLSTQPKQVPVQ